MKYRLRDLYDNKRVFQIHIPGPPITFVYIKSIGIEIKGNKLYTAPYLISFCLCGTVFGII